MFKHSREFHIPAGSIKVADKLSDAVAYLYADNTGRPCARVFFGKQTKPVTRYAYKSEAQRTSDVTATFEGRRASLKAKKELREDRKARGRKTEVGALYYTMWGYEQTNVDFYEVVELVGACSAKVRRISGIDASRGNEAAMTGKSIPAAGQYLEEPVLVRVNGDNFKIDGHSASRWSGQPVSWTAYA